MPQHTRMRIEAPDYAEEWVEVELPLPPSANTLTATVTVRSKADPSKVTTRRVSTKAVRRYKADAASYLVPHLRVFQPWFDGRRGPNREIGFVVELRLAGARSDGDNRIKVLQDMFFETMHANDARVAEHAVRRIHNAREPGARVIFYLLPTSEAA